MIFFSILIYNEQNHFSIINYKSMDVNNKTNNKTAVEYTWRFVVEGAGGGGGLWIWGEGNFYQL